jgi:hypothetical protein
MNDSSRIKVIYRGQSITPLNTYWPGEALAGRIIQANRKKDERHGINGMMKNFMEIMKMIKRGVPQEL